MSDQTQGERLTAAEWEAKINGSPFNAFCNASVVEVDYDNLYCASDCSAEKWNTDHWFAEVGVNAGFNEYDGTMSYKRPVHVLQKPGEVLYIPNGMVHAVLNLDHTIAVAAHFASTQNLQEVWNTIVGLGSDKHWQQAYFSGILDREQRRFVRSVSGSWPPKPGDDRRGRSTRP